MYQLKNDDLKISFSTVGGSLTSIKDKDNLEYLWQGDKTYWSGQAPVLFPICGSLRNDWAIFKPSGYPHFTGIIPRHGLIRKKDFLFKPLDKQTVAFSIESDAEMYRNYPYDFKVTIVYHLEGKVLTVKYVVENRESQKIMPFSIGGHPAFNCPLYKDEKFEDYYITFEKTENCSIPKQFPETGLLDCQNRTDFLKNTNILPLNFDLFAKDAITFDQLQSRQVQLRSRKHSKGVQIDFSDFPNLILWTTTNQGPFLAIEPWSGLSTSLEESDIFQEKQGVRFIQPKQKDILSFKITILG